MRSASAVACASSSSSGTASRIRPIARGLRRRDLVAGQQVALRALEAHAVDPHRGRRRAPDARRRIAEARARPRRSGRRTAPCRCRRRCTSPAPRRSSASARTRASCSVRRSATIIRVVGDRVPRARRARRLRRLCARRRPVEPVAGAERRALGAQQDHAHVGSASASSMAAASSSRSAGVIVLYSAARVSVMMPTPLRSRCEASSWQSHIAADSTVGTAISSNVRAGSLLHRWRRVRVEDNYAADCLSRRTS